MGTENRCIMEINSLVPYEICLLDEATNTPHIIQVDVKNYGKTVNAQMVSELLAAIGKDPEFAAMTVISIDRITPECNVLLLDEPSPTHN